MSDEELRVRIPKAKKMAQIFGIIEEDEDFRLGKIKIERDKQRYTVPDPLEDDAENTASVKSFYGVVVYFRKCFFNNTKDGEAAEKVEKRELVVVRTGKFMPELLYISKSGFYNWRGFLDQRDKAKEHYSHVLCKFTAEPGQSTDGQFKFSKVKIEFVRLLETEELEYIAELQPIVRDRVRKYSSSSEQLEAAEDKFLDDEDKKLPKNSDEDEDDAIAAKAAKRTRAVAEKDDDDEDEEPVKKSKKKAPVDDDDEDEEPVKKKKKAAPVEDDDDEDEEPVKKSKKKAPVDDDDEDEEPVKKKKKKAPVEDDEDEEPVKKKKKKTEEPVTKSKGKYPDIDDDDDEDLKPKKKKAPVEDDEDED